MTEFKNVLSIFEKDKIDFFQLEQMFNIDIKGLSFGMTDFQISNFIMNRKEFTTDFAQFKQSKFEIRNRLLTIVDLYFQYKEAIINKQLSEGRIEKINNEETYSKIKYAKVKLQELEVEKNDFKINSFLNEAIKISQEIKSFYVVYDKFRHFDSLSEEELAKLEEESWLIKSAYYPELQERYGLTPKGFLKLPHQKSNDILKFISEYEYYEQKLPIKNTL